MTLKKGDHVIIHNSKLNNDLFIEGEAILIRKNKLQPEPDRELWTVRFTNEPENKYHRFVEEKNKVNTT